MTDKEKIVHDLALIHAKEKYHEFYPNIPNENRKFNGGVSELCNFYEVAVIMISHHIDEIMESYLDDDGKPLLGK